MKTRAHNLASCLAMGGGAYRTQKGYLVYGYFSPIWGEMTFTTFKEFVQWAKEYVELQQKHNPLWQQTCEARKQIVGTRRYTYTMKVLDK